MNTCCCKIVLFEIKALDTFLSLDRRHFIFWKYIIQQHFLALWSFWASFALLTISWASSLVKFGPFVSFSSSSNKSTLPSMIGRKCYKETQTFKLWKQNITILFTFCFLEKYWTSPEKISNHMAWTIVSPFLIPSVMKG